MGFVESLLRFFNWNLMTLGLANVGFLIQFNVLKLQASMCKWSLCDYGGCRKLLYL